MAPTRISYASALLLLAISSLAAAESPNQGPVALPITAAPVKNGSPLSRRNGDITLSNITSVAYLVTLSIGTPGQKVKVVIDTGSDELWVNPTCDNITGDDGTEEKVCKQSGHYSPGNSSTSKQLADVSSIHYGKGKVSIAYYKDTVAQADSNVTLKNVKFGVAMHSTDLYEGILGLGFSANTNYSTFVDAVAQQNATGGTNRVFSIALGSAHQANAGTLVLGGLDANRFAGKMAAVPILPPPAATDPLVRYWVQLDSIGYTSHDAGANRMTNKTYPSSGGPVVLDTGSSLSILPGDVLDAVVKDLGADPKTARTAHYYQVPCTSVGLGGDKNDKDNQAGLMRSVDFSFNGGAAFIRVPLSEFALPLDATTCLLGAMSSGGDSSSSGGGGSGGGSGGGGGGGGTDLDVTKLLGATFLRGAYVVFDQSANSVFMAPYASCNGGTASLQALASAVPGAAGNVTGACSAADTLANGGAGGIAMATSSNGTTPSDNKKNGGLRSSSLSTASLLLVALPVLAMLLM